MQNEIKVSKRLNFENGQNEISYMITWRYNNNMYIEHGCLTYHKDELLKMHLKVMEMEKKFGIKASYKGFEPSDFKGCVMADIDDMKNLEKMGYCRCNINYGDPKYQDRFIGYDKAISDTLKVSQNINKEFHNKNLDLYYQNEDLYKEIEELKDQLYVSEELNKELNKKYQISLDNYINLQYENIKIREENKKLNDYMTLHKSDLFKVYDENVKLQEEIYKLNTKIGEYKEDSILLDEVRKEYNKTCNIPRYIYEGFVYITEDEYLKLNLKFQIEKQKRQNIIKQIESIGIYDVGDIKINLKLDGKKLTKIIDKRFNDNINKCKRAGFK